MLIIFVLQKSFHCPLVDDGAHLCWVDHFHPFVLLRISLWVDFVFWFALPGGLPDAHGEQIQILLFFFLIFMEYLLLLLFLILRPFCLIFIL